MLQISTKVRSRKGTFVSVTRIEDNANDDTRVNAETYISDSNTGEVRYSVLRTYTAALFPSQIHKLNTDAAMR